MNDFILVKGAREHNLKDITVQIPKNKITVITGLSGSGKSSLAFDTIFAEGQRRYLESLPSFVRQFIDQMNRPDVDAVEGLSPAISIAQHTSAPGPRSIVATTTDIFDYFRVLYATLGIAHCPKCGKKVIATGAELVTEKLLKEEDGTRLTILSPLVRAGGVKELQVALEFAARAGYVRVRLDDELFEIEDVVLPSDSKTSHKLEAVVDRIVIKEGIRHRLSDSVESSMLQSNGGVVVIVKRKDETKEDVLFFSEKYECLECGVSFDKLQANSFSFNTYEGACPKCHGLGEELYFDEYRIVPDTSLSLSKGAIKAWKRGPKRLIASFNTLLKSVAAELDISMDEPWENIPKEKRDIILYGSGDNVMKLSKRVRSSVKKYTEPFEGVIPNLERRLRESESDSMRIFIKGFMSFRECSVCKGKRFRKEVLSCTISNNGKETSIADILSMSISEAYEWANTLEPLVNTREAVENLLKGIRERLSFLINVGLGYLTLDRSSATLSGGELQRIRLASQIGSGLSGVLYVLDEPTIGLHSNDTSRLISMMERMRDLGNTLVVVEHDEQVIRAADYVIDIGPGAGANGGYIVAQGTPAAIEKNHSSLTGRFMSGREKRCVPEKVQIDSQSNFLELSNVNKFNLKNVSVKFPIGAISVVTGVSGSGKSTLVDEVLYDNLKAIHYSKSLNEVKYKHCDAIRNGAWFSRIIMMDSLPMGRSARSNLLTYIGVFDTIRELFASTQLAKLRGYKATRFSFNVHGGRCEVCKGVGSIELEMNFLPDVSITCEQCHGKRYNKETLDIHYAGRSIYDVLELTVDEAVEVFKNIPKLVKKFSVLKDVGLGYLKLGQSGSTLSGGESQRLKLALELSRYADKNVLYIFDEPTTGLHFADVKKLVEIFVKLREKGHTIIVIEHNPDVIAAADWIVELGPGGGDEGGRVVRMSSND